MHFSFSGKIPFRLLLMIISLSCVLLVTGCDVKVNGQSYPKDTESFTLTENVEDYSVFNQFSDLKTLDLTALDISPSDFSSISSQLNDSIQVVWNVPVGNTKIPSDSATIEITPETNLTDPSVIQYFNKLETLRISSVPSSKLLLDVYKTAKETNPDVVFNCTTSVYGVEINNETHFLNLNAAEIDDLSELDYALEMLPNIKTVEICSCKLDNETIAAFRDKYSDRKVVWTVRFGKFAVRTDAQIFSTLAKIKYHELNSETLSPLFRYCTELRALDLGHCELTDISELANLKHLHTLILAANSISDASPIAELKELNYIEIQYNRIKDATPFGELPKLEDLYIVENHGLKNIKAIANCKNLVRVDIAACGIGKGEYAVVRKMVPKNCKVKIEYYGGNNLKEWRRLNKKNSNIRKAFASWNTIKEFPDWQTTVNWDRDVYDFSKNYAE